jgi:GAF domain-containing protein
VLGAHTTQRHDFTENDVHFIQAVANILTMPIGSKQTEEAECFLAQASTILASTLDYGTTIEQIVRLAVPTLADWCTLDILGEGHSRCVAVAHVDPAKEALLWKLRRHYPLLPEGSSPGSQALRTRQSVLYPQFREGELPQTTQDTDHLRLITALAPVSVMVVPLAVHGKTIGVMTLTSIHPERSLPPADVHLTEELAGRAAIAIDNARLYREAQQAVRAR